MTSHHVITNFEKFYKGDYPDGHYNLYIVWYGKKALYVGVSHRNIWNRWFSASHSHIQIAMDGHWRGMSTIGQVIVDNLPLSSLWNIELREISIVRSARELEEAEFYLIVELHPIFNVKGQQDLTDEEIELMEKLIGSVKWINADQ